MCFNITTYLKEKKQIEPYLTSFHYIFRLIRGAEELSEIHAQQLEGRLSKDSKAVATVWKAEQKCVTWDAYVERRSDGYCGGLYQYDAASGHHRIQHHAACGAEADGKY